jgi:hypothetical protein
MECISALDNSRARRGDLQASGLAAMVWYVLRLALLFLVTGMAAVQVVAKPAEVAAININNWNSGEYHFFWNDGTFSNYSIMDNKFVAVSGKIIREIGIDSVFSNDVNRAWPKDSSGSPKQVVATMPQSGGYYDLYFFSDGTASAFNKKHKYFELNNQTAGAWFNGTWPTENGKVKTVSAILINKWNLNEYHFFWDDGTFSNYSIMENKFVEVSGKIIRKIGIDSAMSSNGKRPWPKDSSGSPKQVVATIPQSGGDYDLYFFSDGTASAFNKKHKYFELNNQTAGAWFNDTWPQVEDIKTTANLLNCKYGEDCHLPSGYNSINFITKGGDWAENIHLPKALREGDKVTIHSFAGDNSNIYIEGVLVGAIKTGEVWEFVVRKESGKMIWCNTKSIYSLLVSGVDILNSKNIYIPLDYKDESGRNTIRLKINGIDLDNASDFTVSSSNTAVLNCNTGVNGVCAIAGVNGQAKILVQSKSNGSSKIEVDVFISEDTERLFSGEVKRDILSSLSWSHKNKDLFPDTELLNIDGITVPVDDQDAAGGKGITLTANGKSILNHPAFYLSLEPWSESFSYLGGVLRYNGKKGLNLIYIRRIGSGEIVKKLTINVGEEGRNVSFQSSNLVNQEKLTALTWYRSSVITSDLMTQFGVATPNTYINTENKSGFYFHVNGQSLKYSTRFYAELDVNESDPSVLKWRSDRGDFEILGLGKAKIIFKDKIRREDVKSFMVIVKGSGEVEFLDDSKYNPLIHNIKNVNVKVATENNNPFQIYANGLMQAPVYVEVAVQNKITGNWVELSDIKTTSGNSLVYFYDYNLGPQKGVGSFLDIDNKGISSGFYSADWKVSRFKNEFENTMPMSGYSDSSTSPELSSQENKLRAGYFDGLNRYVYYVTSERSNNSKKLCVRVGDNVNGDDYYHYSCSNSHDEFISIHAAPAKHYNINADFHYKEELETVDGGVDVIIHTLTPTARGHKIVKIENTGSYQNFNNFELLAVAHSIENRGDFRTSTMYLLRPSNGVVKHGYPVGVIASYSYLRLYDYNYNTDSGSLYFLNVVANKRYKRMSVHFVLGSVGLREEIVFMDNYGNKGKLVLDRKDLSWGSGAKLAYVIK